MADTHRLINKGTADEIYELQRFLIAYNFTDASDKAIRATLQFDKPTVEALKKFQEQQGLTVDGKAGKNTIQAMVKYGEETDIPAKQEPEAPKAEPVATGTAGLNALPSVTPASTTKTVAKPIQTEPKMGEPKPQAQDAATQARLAGLKRAQQGQAGPTVQKSAPVQAQAPSPGIQSQKPVARPVQQTPAQQGPSYQDNPGAATPTGKVAKPVVTPADGPPADTEMRPTNLGAEKNAEKSAKEPQVSTDPATISNKGEEKVPAPAASPNQMAVDQTNKALDDWVKAYTPLKARDVQPVKTFGAMLKNLKDIYSTGQEAIRSDPKLSARWKQIVADVTEYHSNPEGKRQVNEAQALADALFEEEKSLRQKMRGFWGGLFGDDEEEKPASTSVPSMAGRRTNIRKTLDKSQNVEQGKITNKVVPLVKQKLQDLGYDPKDVPGNPELAKVYRDIGKTIQSIQSIVKQYEQKGLHADLVNMKKQFNTLQTQLSTYTQG